MKFKILTLALLASAATAAPAAAQISGNVALTTNYVFRGITQTDDGPAIQGGFDYEDESGFYIGTWGSSVDFSDDTTMELDVYGGYGFSGGGFDWDIGAIAYIYPDSPELPTGSQNFVEVYGGVGRAFGPVEWSASLAYSPEFYGEIGPAWYAQTGLGIEIAEGIVLDGAIGFSQFDDAGGDYEDYQVGLSGTVFETVGWDLRFFDASDGGDESFAFTISQSFGG